MKQEIRVGTDSRRELEEAAGGPIVGSPAQDPNDMHGRVLYRGATVISAQLLRDYAQPVLVKEIAHAPPPSHEVEAVAAEYELSRRLSCGSVRQVLGKEIRNGFPALILEPVEGLTIREHLRTVRPGLAERLRLARDLARAVAGIHAANVVHNDLTDTNVLVRGQDRSIVIIDLGSAAWRDGGGPAARLVQPKRDSLPYLPPERAQSQRWEFDFTGDTYSLGVILYQILTDELPFRSEDPQALFHEHAARQPTPPSCIAPAVPRMLDRIVLKLLAKDRDERYQSAFGLLNDLQECVDQYDQAGRILPFPIGAADRSSRLRKTGTLYGRGEQREQLRRLVLEDSCDGPRFVLVSGYAGIGKTALVREMRGPIHQAGGIFIQGKAEQYRSNVPYTVISTAFRDLVTSVLSMTDRDLDRWRGAISTALGDEAKALAAVVPDLNRVVDVPKEIAFLGGHEARDRLHYLLRRLVEALTGLQRPVVVFLDDLQWIDHASLELLTAVISDKTLEGLSVIGACRDNEVGNDHRLSAALKQMETAGIRVERIALDNLELPELSALLQATLGPAAGIDVLSSLLFEKTLGNPFFVRQLLEALVGTDQIRFNLETQEWEWDIESLKALEVSENVVDHLASTIGSLDSRTQNLLRLAACAGSRFNPAILASVRSESVAEVVAALGKPRVARLVHPDEGCYRFVHDRIQQAVYGMAEDSDRRRCHFEIGRRLLKITPEEQLDERIFEIVDHLNTGSPLVVDQGERYELAHLNLRSARRSRDSAACAAMLEYLERGIDLLAPDSWRTNYPLTLELHTMVLEAAYCNGDFEKALERAQSVFQNARSVLDRVRAHEVTMRCYCACGRMREAIETGSEVLAALGVEMLRSPPPAVDVQSCRELPQMTDPEGLAAVRILTLMFPAAMIAAPELCPSVVFSLIDQSLEHGNCAHSSFAYALYGVFLCRDPQTIPRAYQFGELALHMLEAGGGRALRNQAREIAYAFVGSWKARHVREVMDDMRRLVQSSLQSGEIDIACNQLMRLTMLLHCVGEPLHSARLQLADNIRSIAELKPGFQLKIAKVWAQLQLTLGGLSGDPVRLIGEYFDENSALPELEGELRLTRYYSYLPIAIHRFFAGDYEQCLRYSGLAAEQGQQLFGFPIAAVHAFYRALAMLQLYPAAGQEKQVEYLQSLDPIRRTLQALADQDTVNFPHGCYLVEAETARVLGDFERALRFYERAITAARTHRFPGSEALACELAGRFCLAQGLRELAGHYLIRSYSLYGSWGVVLKTRALDQEFPDLLGDSNPQAVGRERAERSSLTSGKPDLESAFKALRALSSETDLETLLKRMMGIVMEHAGAESAVLLLRQDRRWVIKATGDFQAGCYAVLLNLPYDQGSAERDGAPLPASVVNLCLRSERPLLISDAVADPRFSVDPYIRRHRVKSILCLPLLHQGRVRGYLYL
ncbi:MAG: AAA family ATPase, partial [Spirochaetales bacterium]|nr:AAA family ATPase [Spirochaetales bacterium]